MPEGVVLVTPWCFPEGGSSHSFRKDRFKFRLAVHVALRYRRKANIGPTWLQHSANMGPTWPPKSLPTCSRAERPKSHPLSHENLVFAVPGASEIAPETSLERHRLAVALRSRQNPPLGRDFGSVLALLGAYLGPRRAQVGSRNRSKIDRKSMKT